MRKVRTREPFRRQGVMRFEMPEDSLCELSNAHLKHHHGVAQVLVRGTAKVTCVALLCALTANLVTHAAALLG
jgi:hypothetical protein